MILICLILGAVAGGMFFSRGDESVLLGAVIGALGGVMGLIVVWLTLSIIGLVAGAAGALVGALALLWLYRRYRDG